ncbi:hypothetical protein GOP47_0027678 [Adiantum capillus-veneris]|nr:hypothetical protein GOP47_0027678 [Adiantum capillus-veneris]
MQENAKTDDGVLSQAEPTTSGSLCGIVSFTSVHDDTGLAKNIPETIVANRIKPELECLIADLEDIVQVCTQF